MSKTTTVQAQPSRIQLPFLEEKSMSTNLEHKSNRPYFDKEVESYCRQIAEVINERLGKLKDEDGYIPDSKLGFYLGCYEDDDLPLEDLITDLLGEWGRERISSFCDISRCARREFSDETLIDIAVWEQFEKRYSVTINAKDVYYEDHEHDKTRAYRHVNSWEIILSVN